MESVICTLFEGNYHFGLGALVNSLYENGFKGDFFAGYRGDLPKWAKNANLNPMLEEWNVKTLFIEETISLHFVPLTTKYHFTNYKSNFMLELLEGPAKNAYSIFYFDPDIVVNYNWSFFEEWVEYGITVCEDVNSPLPLEHPRRMAWHKYFKEVNLDLNFRLTNYANGGFVGIKNENIDFLKLWKVVQENIAQIVGGFDRTSVPGMAGMKADQKGPYFPFNIPDQDALNITIAAWKKAVSFIGKEGMCFKHGPNLMAHALGSPKPWNTNYLARSLNGFRPKKVDKLYWGFVLFPIGLYPSLYVTYKNFLVKLTALLGRFYGRS